MLSKVNQIHRSSDITLLIDGSLRKDFRNIFLFIQREKSIHFHMLSTKPIFEYILKKVRIAHLFTSGFQKRFKHMKTDPKMQN